MVRSCPSCSEEIPTEALVCPTCATPLTPPCTRCGADSPEGARFCPSCGEPLPNRSADIEERKLATVLFVDVSGSTGLGERLDPERLREVMTTYFSTMREAIEAEGGTVEKFIGDAIMAVFGVPSAHEDDPIRSLRAALRIHSRLGELNERLAELYGVTIEVRIGVNTGEVLASTAPEARMGMVSGDAVNVAARLQESAEPGQVVVAERTARSARSSFRFRELGKLRLRGHDQGVTAYELLSETSSKWDIAGVRAPLIGRREELSLLSALYQRATRELRPHLVTVYGAAGVGKSRLVTEFLDEVAPRGPAVLRERCPPYGEGVTYWPLAKILRSLAGVLESDSPDTVSDRIRELTARVVESDSAHSAAVLAYMIGVDDPNIRVGDLSPRQVKMETHAAWRALLSGLARNAPLVMVIEDIHWAEPALLELLEELADRAEGPILLLCSARPELSARVPGWGGGHRNASSLFLEPLSEPESRDLLNHLFHVEELPSRLRGRILERAEGNPFFLEEIVRNLIDEGVLQRRNGSWKVADAGGHIDIPDTVQAVLAARIDLLEAREKRALQCAAVIGRTFWSGLLAELLAPEFDGDLRSVLGELERRELITSRVTSAMTGQDEYSFKHALTREVAYESLPKRDRFRFHAQAARTLERIVGDRVDQLADLLARHYELAYQGSLEDLRASDSEGSLREKATHYLLLASEEARKLLVLDKAQRFAERAFEVAEGPLERSTVLEALGLIAFYGYRGDEVWDSLKEAIEERAKLQDDDPRNIARLCGLALETALRWRGSMRSPPDRSEMERYLEMGFSHAGTEDNEELLRLLMVQAFWPWAYPDVSPELGFEAGERAVQMAQRLDRGDLESASLDAITAGYAIRGLYGHPTVAKVISRRLELSSELRDPWERGDAFAMAAWSTFHVGRFEDTYRHADEGFRSVIADVPGVALHCLAWRTVASYALGDWAALLRDFAQVEEMLGERRESPPWFAIRPFAAVALVHEIQGNRPAADRLLTLLRRLSGTDSGDEHTWTPWVVPLLARRGHTDEAERLLDLSPGRWGRINRGLLLEARCELVAEADRWEEIRELTDDASAHAEEAGILTLPFHVDRLEGLAALASGDPDGATERLRRSAGGFRSLGAAWEAARGDLFLARALAHLRESQEAVKALDRSAPVLDRLSALRELAEARRLAQELDAPSLTFRS